MGRLGWGWWPKLHNLWPPLIAGIQAQAPFPWIRVCCCVLGKTARHGWLAACWLHYKSLHVYATIIIKISTHAVVYSTQKRRWGRWSSEEPSEIGFRQWEGETCSVLCSVTQGTAAPGSSFLIHEARGVGLEYSIGLHLIVNFCASFYESNQPNKTRKPRIPPRTKVLPISASRGICDLGKGIYERG